MLKQLEIKNYALIKHIDLDFDKGLTIITGETGAGKSILLGGLELILGKRAQQGLLNNPDKKSIVEANFKISKYGLKKFFKQQDIDYEDETIIRRELLPGGKSRAFVNDSPIRLDVISNLTSQLIDIHSQHQTLELNQKDFQYKLIDAIAGNDELLRKYQEELSIYKTLEKQKTELQQKLDTAQEELEYKSFQFKELEALDLENIDFEAIEQRLNQLEHAEEIGLILTESSAKIDNEEFGVHNLLIDLRNAFMRIQNLSPKFEELAQRLESMQIEMQDISVEISNLVEENEYSPAEKEQLRQQFDEINRLTIKHKVQNVSELIELRDKLDNEVADLSDLENTIQKIDKKLKDKHNELSELAEKISKNRKKSIPDLIAQIEKILQKLSMKHTRLKIDLSPSLTFLNNGKDQIDFQISSDDGKHFGRIKQIASGGELSRIMLAVKTVLSKYKKLPTIIFDEIDSGISGEVAQNMAEVLSKMSKNMQVIVITHLPQIAAVGEQHYKVFKNTDNQQIETKVKLLNNDERIREIAEMIEGKSPSESALNHAKHLLKKV